jgi:uncharacterized membrane protein
VNAASQEKAVSAQKAAFRNRIRRRAIVDAIAIAAVAFAVSQPVANPHDSLAVGIAAVALGMLLFVVRRGRDLAQFADAVRQRERALDGAGISLADWHGGQPLPPWSERRMQHARAAE